VVDKVDEEVFLKEEDLHLLVEEDTEEVTLEVDNDDEVVDDFKVHTSMFLNLLIKPLL
jgi:hypothetical protein